MTARERVNQCIEQRRPASPSDESETTTLQSKFHLLPRICCRCFGWGNLEREFELILIHLCRIFLNPCRMLRVEPIVKKLKDAEMTPTLIPKLIAIAAILIAGVCSVATPLVGKKAGSDTRLET